MIMSVEELRAYISTDETDAVLSSKLAALELLIRKYTNNNFQKRNFRNVCNISDNQISPVDALFIGEGDTIEVSESVMNNDIYTVDSVSNGVATIDGVMIDEEKVLVTKVVYPVDIKMGAVNLMKWELENRSKVGIQSEAISRHSVTYFNMDGDNAVLGYPKSLVGFLKPYMKARF